MLSKDCTQLMEWIGDQWCPVPMARMQELLPPGFSEQRVNDLRKDGFLKWEYVPFGDGLAAGYSLSDKGKAYLEEREQIAEKATQQAAEKRAEHKFQIFYVLLGSLLTLLIEHGPRIFNYLQTLLS